LTFECETLLIHDPVVGVAIAHLERDPKTELIPDLAALQGPKGEFGWMTLGMTNEVRRRVLQLINELYPVVAHGSADPPIRRRGSRPRLSP
jgi:hypothetical protein